MTSVEEIAQWRRASTERENLELKEAREQFDNGKLFRCCIALANEGGGTLLLGIEDVRPRPALPRHYISSKI